PALAGRAHRPGRPRRLRAGSGRALRRCRQVESRSVAACLHCRQPAPPRGVGRLMASFERFERTGPQAMNIAQRRHALTPEALEMMDTIERTGSFAAAARELGKVPSALTYSVRQLEDALDVLLFDRRSRQARLTAAGHELLSEGRRLLAQMD